jgi:hypothetical protein
MPQGELLHGEYLERQGVIHRTEITFPGVTPAQIELMRAQARNGIGVALPPGSILDRLTESHIEIFRRLEAAAPGMWAFATIGDGMDSPPTEADTNYRGGLLELYDCLPVPLSDVAYEDILAFKDKYKSERLDLRSSLDSVYRSIENDFDRPLAHNAEISRLEISLSNLRKSVSGYGLKYSLEYCGIQLSWLAVCEIGKQAAAAFYEPGITSKLALAGAIGACMAFTPTLRRSQINVPDALKYIYHARRDNIVGDISSKPR